jgi:hypothetical protein
MKSTAINVIFDALDVGRQESAVQKYKCRKMSDLLVKIKTEFYDHEEDPANRFAPIRTKSADAD